MNCLLFDLHLSKEDYLAWYAGVVRSVSVMSLDGRRIEFPAEHLRAFVTHEGIHGRFELCFGADNRFASIRRLA